MNAKQTERIAELQSKILAQCDSITQGRTGVAIIAEERARQIREEGRTLDKDAEYSKGELVRAAFCYVAAHAVPLKMMRAVMKLWPWDKSWWKPDDNRSLAKAGALIAAELDQKVAAALPIESGVKRIPLILPATVLNALDDSVESFIQAAVKAKSQLMEQDAVRARCFTSFSHQLHQINELIDFLDSIGRASNYRSRLEACLLNKSRLEAYAAEEGE